MSNRDVLIKANNGQEFYLSDVDHLECKNDEHGDAVYRVITKSGKSISIDKEEFDYYMIEYNFPVVMN